MLETRAMKIWNNTPSGVPIYGTRIVSKQHHFLGGREIGAGHGPGTHHPAFHASGTGLGSEGGQVGTALLVEL